MLRAAFPSCAGNASSVEKTNFFKEIEMMKKVSAEDNELSKFVVNMLGCVTLREPMMLVLEFMKHGNLLEYLRTMKKRVRETSAKMCLESGRLLAEILFQ